MAVNIPYHHIPNADYRERCLSLLETHLTALKTSTDLNTIAYHAFVIAYRLKRLKEAFNRATKITYVTPSPQDIAWIKPLAYRCTVYLASRNTSPPDFELSTELVEAVKTTTRNFLPTKSKEKGQIALKAINLALTVFDQE